jgi:hypothetical protein
VDGGKRKSGVGNEGQGEGNCFDLSIDSIACQLLMILASSSFLGFFVFVLLFQLVIIVPPDWRPIPKLVLEVPTAS